ncbi:MAG: hypothetical protein AAF518_07845 [Spirochaetota bacterium]
MKYFLHVTFLISLALSLPVSALSQVEELTPAPLAAASMVEETKAPTVNEESKKEKPLPTPAPPNVEDLVNGADCIVKVNFEVVETQEILNMTHVTASAKIEETFKQKEDMGSQIDLYFFTLAVAESNWMQAPPEKGEYIIFLKHKPVLTSDGGEDSVISLHEPHSFSLRKITPELLKEIKSLTGREAP